MLYTNTSEALLARPPRRKIQKIIFAIAVLILILFLTGATAIFVWAQKYDDRIAPNVFIGSIPIGGLDEETARIKIQTAIDQIMGKGIPINLEGEEKFLPLLYYSARDASDDIVWETEKTLFLAARARRTDNRFEDALNLFLNLWRPTEIKVTTVINQENITKSLRNLWPDKEKEAVNASFKFLYKGNAWNATVVAGEPGYRFALEPFFFDLQNQLEKLVNRPINLERSRQEPLITEKEGEILVPAAEEVMRYGPYIFTYRPVNQPARVWEMNASQLRHMLQPSLQNRRLVLAVTDNKFNEYLDTLAPSIEIKAANARFVIKDGRVTEFIKSHAGIALDRPLIKENFEKTLNTKKAEITLSLIETAPDVTTSDADELGITEALGVGTSNYRGSPVNRIKNIRNGVRLLNGILIAPEETFSLVAALRPFVTDNGYLPELVIRGDKIIPEIGGGLCQIGTTTFRATMNSGLPITERRNHSIVVSYYNDPSNNNPGTDATIYEPAPDFKFFNDTGHYVLFQAEMLEQEQQLKFTFWGTADGRHGSYTPPEVIRWIPTGPEKRIETIDLEPGKESCQAAHVGADTNFIYTIVRPDGTAEQQEFSSHYRPLPKICLVGVEKLSAPAVEMPTENPVTVLP